MKRSNKKGFTTVELVIVIAVIAILAAVLIPTFANLVEKANMSADQQAIRQINTVLKMEEAEGNVPEEIHEVKAILLENGYSANLAPVYDGYTFGWIKEDNVAVLIKDNAIVYPEDYEGDEYELFNVVKVGTAQDVQNLANGTFAQEGFNSIVLEEDLEVNATDAKGNYLEFKNVGNVEIDGDGKTLSANLNVSEGKAMRWKNVTIDSTETGKNDASAVKPLDGTIYLNDVTITAPKFGFAQNAGQSSPSVAGSVKNSTFNAPYALYIAMGDWVFEDCHFNGTITIAGGNVKFINCTFTAMTEAEGGLAYAETFNTSKSGGFFSDNAIVIVDGRDTAHFQSGKVSFTNCTVTNSNGVDTLYVKGDAGVSGGNVVTVDDSGLKLK